MLVKYNSIFCTLYSMLMSLKLVGEIDFQVAAWVSYMFYNFYLMKNHKIAHNSTTTEARKN
jgi:hypothetical protein